MIGDTTIYHLINDSLMAELSSFQDEKKFRHIWRLWRVSNRKENLRFIHPKSAFEDAEFSFTPELLNDWNEQKDYSFRLTKNVPDSILLSLFPQQHKRRFFVFLLWETLELQSDFLKYSVHKEPSQIQRQYIIMSYLTSLEQLIEDNHSYFKKTIELEIRKDYQLLMSYFRLILFRYFGDYIHLKSLRYFEEELLLLFEDDETEGIQSLAKYLKGQLKEKPLLSEKEFKNMAPLEIAHNLQTEMGSLKKVVQKLKDQEPLEMNQDEYLKPKYAAKFLGIGTGTLSNWRNKKKINRYKKVGNRYEYSFNELKQLKNHI